MVVEPSVMPLSAAGHAAAALADEALEQHMVGHMKELYDCFQGIQQQDQNEIR